LIDRGIVLRSSVLRIGDHIDLQAVGIPSTPRIGDRVEAVLVLRTDRPIDILTLDSAEGLSASGREVRMERSGGDLRGGLSWEFEGDEGPSTLAISIVTGDVGATAGKLEMAIEVRQRRTSIRLQGAPIHWSGAGPIEIGVGLNNPSRVKGELSARLISPDGKAVAFRRPARSKVSFKGDKVEALTLDPIDGLPPGLYDLTVTLQADIGVDASFEDAVVVDEKGPELGIVVTGAGSWARTHVPVSTGPLEAWIVRGGQKAPLRTRTADGRMEIFIPDDAAGKVGIEVRQGSWTIVSGEITALPPSPLESISIAPFQSMVKAGAETHCTISFLKRAETPMKAALTIGGEGQIKAHSDLIGIEGSAEVRFRVPKDMRTGVQPCILEVLSGEGPIHRSIRTDLFSVISEISVQVTLEVPSVEAEGEIGVYLFPGESVRSSETMCGLTVHSLSTGRRLMQMDGRLVGGRGWEERSDPEALSAYTLLLFREALTDQEFRRVLREAVERCERSTGEVKGDLADLPPVSKAYIGRASGKAKDPLIWKVADFVKGVLRGASATPQDLVEGAAVLWKGSTRPDMSGAVTCMVRCARSAWSAVSSIGASRSGDKDVIERALNELVFLSLIQMEVVSAWSDPALSVWDDLRALRQRSIRRSVDSALGSVEALAMVAKRSEGRFASYRNNMSIRCNLAAVREMRLKGKPTLDTTLSGTLKGSVSLGGGDEACVSDVYIYLPDHSWGVIAPNSSREGIGHYIGRAELPPGRAFTMDLELSVPQGTRKGNVSLYVKPSKDVLEEEA
jgi:hypothetical protein